MGAGNGSPPHGRFWVSGIVAQIVCDALGIARASFLRFFLRLRRERAINGVVMYRYKHIRVRLCIAFVAFGTAALDNPSDHGTSTVRREPLNNVDPVSSYLPMLAIF